MEPLAADDPRYAGEFRLQARLGAGGMGRVFLGYSPAGRAVAVKICHPEIAADPAFVRRFALEVSAARAVNGLYTAQVLDAGPDDNPPWLATAYVPGPTLAEAIDAAGPLPVPAVWRLAAGLAEALRAVHDRGLVHRDLKPNNVLLASDGPRVIDFGVARALDGAALTTTGYTFGTPGFMSPEQVMGGPVGPSSDVFALGCVLCFAVTGEGPFGDGTPDAVLYRIVYGEPALDRVPPELRGMVAACLAKDAAGRPALAQVLHACQDRITLPEGSGTPGYATGGFWPGSVATLISRHQASLSRVSAGVLSPGSGVGLAAGAGVGSPGAGVVAPARVSRRRVLVAGGVVVAAGLAAGGWELAQPKAPARRVRTTGAATSDRLVWARSTGGPVSSGAAVAGDVVYIGSGDGSVYAYEAGTGEPVRTYAGSGAINAAVTVTSGTLLAGRSDGVLSAVSVGTGGRGWTHSVGATTGAPVVAGGVVYVGSHDKYVYALDSKDGSRIWHYQTGGSVQHAPLPGAGADNQTVYAGSDDGYVYSFDAARGKLQWRRSIGGKVSSGLIQDPGGSSVFAGSSTGSLYSLLPPPYGQLWKAPAGGAIRGTPAAVQQTILVGSADGMVRALTLDSGDPLWQYRTSGPVASGLAVQGSMVYAGSDDGYLYAIDVTTGDVIWKFRTGGPVRSQILVSGGLVYFGSQDHKVYALRA